MFSLMGRLWGDKWVVMGWILKNNKKETNAFMAANLLLKPSPISEGDDKVQV